MINTILNQRYQIQEQLSKQPGRRTFLALDLESQNLVVIKILLLDRDFAWEKLKLFEREAKTLKNLNHTAIPQYLDYFEIDLPNCQGFALVQEYIDAPSLEAHIENGRNFSEADLKEIAASILEILIYLHQLQPPLIHRDIKPSNILLTKNRSGNSIGEIFLVDFGSVQNSAAIDRGTITIVGTYGYMPPEQFGGRTVSASDLYGLGATLIYLATGQNPADLPQKNLQVQLNQVTNLSSGFQAWLNKAMEPTLKKRFASAEKALDLLDNSSLEVSQTNQPTFDSSRIVLTQTLNAIHVKLFPNICKAHSQKTEKVNRLRSLARYLIISSSLFTAKLRSPLNTIFSILIILWFFVLDTRLINPQYFSRYFYLFIFVFILIFISQGMMNYLLSKYIVSELCIDDQNIVFNQTIIGSNLKISSTLLDAPPPSPVENITKVEVIQIVNISRCDRPKNSALAIWAGKIKYEIPSLTLDEAEWLGSEFSDWLQVPIQYRQIPLAK
jgi:serine/threonine protein kinase